MIFKQTIVVYDSLPNRGHYRIVLSKFNKIIFSFAAVCLLYITLLRCLKTFPEHRMLSFNNTMY